MDRLRRVRQADSAAKATRAKEVVDNLLRGGQRISFARVARQASVSTWFVYNNPAVKSAIQEAMADQTGHGVTAAAVVPRARVTPASLHAELALAREEIKELKHQRDALKQRIQLSLGAEIDNPAQAELVRRIQDLERQNQTLVRDLAEFKGQAKALAGQLEESTETVTSLRLALRKAMRAVP